MIPRTHGPLSPLSLGLLQRGGRELSAQALGGEGALLAASAAALLAFWTLLFHALRWTQPRWMSGAPPSSRGHENDACWCTRNVHGIIHASLISLVSVPALIQLLGASPEVQFAFTDHIGQCALDGSNPALIGWDRTSRFVGLAALAVVTFLASDLVILLVHRQMTIDYFVHHVAFIGAGFLTRINCMLPLNGSILLAMEASTPFLNYLLLFRNRGGGYRLSTGIAGSLFFVLFLILRIGFNTYGVVLLWANWRHAAPPWLPSWQLMAILIAITTGCLVQFFWLPGIVKSFSAAIMELFAPGGSAAISEDKASLTICAASEIQNVPGKLDAKNTD
uniref:TLC domain-containing protein n=1 Tax=Pyrodinium bahamense TaxID=73915 RepID=A0A7S0AGE0_9DINO|mmetsp:Transcript_33912/g.93802  ORF Transcript_33912/g.93802 Transcript_33912/m.93802 type:complete len:335 (+) Transcript_33912:46-1050(+)